MISFADFNVSTKRKDFLEGMIKLRDFLSLITVNPEATTPRAFKNLSSVFFHIVTFRSLMQNSGIILQIFFS